MYSLWMTSLAVFREYPAEVAHHAVLERLEDDTERFDDKYDPGIGTQSEFVLQSKIKGEDFASPVNPCCDEKGSENSKGLTTRGY